MAMAAKKCFQSNVKGKSRKFSKFNATGIVTNFQHDMDSLDESRGFGNSGKIDTEMLGSEGSSATNRKKGIGLNVDDFGSEERSLVLFIHEMSPSRRIYLKKRLEKYLYIINKVQKEVDGIDSHPAVLSHQNDIRSCTESERQKKRPPLKSQHNTLEASVTHSRKRPPPDQNDPKRKMSMSEQVESMKPTVGVGYSYAALMKQCESLLERLLSHKYGKVFDKPVDVVKWNIPDYFTIIKYPMDLGTVKSRLISGQYGSLMDFAADVRLTFYNAMTYNPASNCVYTMADTLSNYFESRWKPVEKKILAYVDTDIANQVPPMKKKKIMPKETIVNPEPIKRFTAIMTIEEKQRLRADLEALAAAAELPETIIDFLCEQSDLLATGKIVGDEFEIELDTDALKNDKLFELRKLLDDHSSKKRKTHTMDEPCKEPVDEEDVDILGGVDPSPSYPPVEIEIDKNDSLNAIGHVQQSFQTNPVIDESQSHQEGKNAPSKNQVSPEKLCREDLLLKAKKALEKKQDPNKLRMEQKEPKRQEQEVVKAQLQAEAKVAEKTWRKVDAAASTAIHANRKRKPHREAARPALQKMKKVADEAQRKAKAAVEAKRKRKLEREATRQALQKMEKPEDFNGSNQFMKDLEKTVDINGSCVQDIPLLSFAEVSSAYCSGSSNILEQLGLFLKVHDEDEEEEEESPQNEAGPAYDLEEGEIY